MALEPNSSFYHLRDDLNLERGGVISNLKICYTTAGNINDDKSNVVWVFHALTADSNPFEWWSGLVGNGRIISPEKYFIVCVNMVGSCYGSTSPTDVHFPKITIKDIISCQQLLFKHLDLKKIKIGIGGSMGGQQLLEWSVQEPDLFEIIVPIATNAIHSPWAIAFNEVQRMVLDLGEQKGIIAARAIAMLSYRNYLTFETMQKDTDHRFSNFSTCSYLHYQGNKLKQRFSTMSYRTLSEAMDSHDVGRYFDGIELALARIKSKAIIIGIDTDLLFPLKEQKLLASLIKKSSIDVISSSYGHDGFLVETKKISKALNHHLETSNLD